LEEFPGIKLIKSARNGGFAAGNNLGIAASKGAYLLLLNSDTVLTEDSATRTLDYLKNTPSNAMAGCRMVFPGGSVQHTARRFRSVGWELLDLFRFIPYLVPYRKRSQLMLGKYFRHDENRPCDWLNGAFLLLPRKLVEALPGQKLDERFFLYGEDQLWCEQAKQLGYSSLFFAGTTIIHINSGSTDRSKQIALRHSMMKNELEIMRLRKGEGPYYFLFKFIFVLKEGARNLIKQIVFKLTGKIVR
jgi:GT2 family glycosyltransferase